MVPCGRLLLHPWPVCGSLSTHSEGAGFRRQLADHNIRERLTAMGISAPAISSNQPQPGSFVLVRGRPWLVEGTNDHGGGLSSVRLAAIAVDDTELSHPDNVGYGYSDSEPSRSAAERSALSECRKAGNQNCRIALWFESCGAYAASHRNYGVGWGASEQAANAKALRECGSTACTIVVSLCE